MQKRNPSKNKNKYTLTPVFDPKGRAFLTDFLNISEMFVRGSYVPGDGPLSPTASLLIPLFISLNLFSVAVKAIFCAQSDREEILFCFNIFNFN